MQSLKGKLILDGGKLAGSEFHRTVALICHHDSAGAFGLVLNQPSEHKVGEVLTEPLPDYLKNLSLYLGGPVQPQTLSCLIYETTTDEVTEDTVMPGIRIAHTLDELAELSGEIPVPGHVKFFVGYAGWDSGQLENEMKQEAWLTYPASMQLVFSPPHGGSLEANPAKYGSHLPVVGRNAGRFVAQLISETKCLSAVRTAFAIRADTLSIVNLV